MAIHAEAVDILVHKCRFEPEVALGITEAIEVSITLAQLVTVPVLDARLQELRHELKMESQALRVDFAALRGEVKGEVATLRQEMNTFRAEVAAQLADGLGKLGRDIERVNANLMRWVLLTTIGSMALTMGAKALASLF